MITYVTCDDVDNAFGNAWTSENAKNKAVLWLMPGLMASA